MTRLSTGRLTRLVGAAGFACGLGLAVHPAFASAAPATPAAMVLLATTTTTIVPDTTTSSVPQTTTTVTTTSTTIAPTTTTSTTIAPTTTTSTTIAPATSTLPTQLVPRGKTPWGLIALIVVLIALIGLVILLMVSRKKKSALDAWNRRTLPALSDAGLAREALLSPTAVSDDVELRSAVAIQVERASVALERAGSSAPDPAAGGSANTAAGSLRGLAFAIEADRLLRHGSGTPTGVQLAQADQARRDRDAELQGALSRLRSHVVPHELTG